MRLKLCYIMKRRPALCAFVIGSQIFLAVLVIRGYIQPFHNVNYDNPNHEDWSAQVFQTYRYSQNEKVHIHNEYQLSGIKTHNHQSQSSNLTSIAIGVAITSTGVNNVTAVNINYRFPFFRTLLPSFCKTSTQGYSYHFYIAFDMRDPFFSQIQYLQMFTDTFYSYKKTMCSYVSEIKLHLIECKHDKKPAWAQNDAMMEAYLDHLDYYYRVNDDTLMKSPGWTELYITTLANLDPSNVGVVGPKHYTGNTNILTYDFVHRTHIDVFGFYYPRIFTDWFADDWITTVYQPNRTVKLPQVKVLHTQLLGTRYTNRFEPQYRKQQVDADKETLNNYLKRRGKESEGESSHKVISFTLPATTPDFVYGILRNIQLAKLYFPEWQMRIYVNQSTLTAKDRIYEKMKLLNPKLNIVTVDSFMSNKMPISMFNYLVMDDSSVKVFLLRNALGRLSLRDAEGVNAWLATNSGFYCVHDHSSHVNYPIIPDMWGARTKIIVNRFKSSFKSKLTFYFSKYAGQVESEDLKEIFFLKDIIWPKMKDVSYCHDSVSCKKWPNSHKHPIRRKSLEYLGKKYEAYGIPQNITDNGHSTLVQLTDNACLEK